VVAKRRVAVVSTERVVNVIIVDDEVPYVSPEGEIVELTGERKPVDVGWERVNGQLQPPR
jgi:hypothetical protein